MLAKQFEITRVMVAQHGKCAVKVIVICWAWPESLLRSVYHRAHAVSYFREVRQEWCRGLSPIQCLCCPEKPVCCLQRKPPWLHRAAQPKPTSGTHCQGPPPTHQCQLLTDPVLSHFSTKPADNNKSSMEKFSASLVH